ncbi:MAG TPA: cysteine--tRNA ligase [Candidatus Limnocylindria bacterium]|nr:cysteine--tRNA ligase [Candidatus Limnocylindria bacterium]
MPTPAAPVLRLRDTRRAAIHPVEPLGAGPIGLYVCGITPYDTTHLGHAFTYLAFDVIHRYLEYAGHDVRYVQNLTDVDDDMLARARDVKEDYLALGTRHADRFLADMAALNWLPPDVYARATEHVPQVVAMIERLEAAGLAYRGDGHVYLSTIASPDWGSLSHVSPPDQLALANERGNRPDLPGKRDPLDPVLWQRSLADEPAWPSPWGSGRPGWHIECSAMSVTHLGPRFEIHGGGEDLAFPHHEAERIQSEGATGERPVVGHWVHTGMVRYDANKMSKSLGNLVMVADLLDRWPADAVRLALIRHSYRAELAWTDGLVVDAAEVAARWTTAAARAGAVEPDSLPDEVAAGRAVVLDSLADDLDTPGAIAALDVLAGLALEPADVAAAAGWVLRDLATRILGLRLGGTR